MVLGFFEILLLLAAIIFVSYTYAGWSYDYWKKLGVPGPTPSIPFGNFADIFLGRKPFAEKLQDIYDAYKDEPFVGYFVGSHPILMINDPDVIKHVLIKDFNVFSGRGIKINENQEPLSAHLFNLDDVRWKVLRHKLTPAFTTGKLKQMFYLMSECADNFERHLKNQVAKNDRIECREHAARYTIDVIGSCAFGIDTQALADENSVFRQISRKIFVAGLFLRIKRLMRQIAPRIYTLLNLQSQSPEITEFFIKTVKDTMELRKKENVVRNDFVDLLQQIPKDNVTDGFEWTDNLLAAQAFVFFAAGFETSSTTISFALWELARTPDVQEKLREEVLEFDKKNNGKISYDEVNDMKYLDMVVKETLRKNPPAVGLVRKSTQDYVIPGTKLVLPAGQNIQIPVYALQHDQKYFPKPEVFEPERFSDEAKQSRHPMVYLPFGDGPKNCIGARFGYYQVKLALIKVMKNFRVKPTTKIDEPYVIDKNALVLAPLGGLVLKFEPLGG